MIERNLIAQIHIAKKDLGLDDETYRAVLAREAGVESSKDLDREGFAAVMDYFNRCGYRSPYMKETYGRRRGMASPSQVKLIRALWREWSGSDDEAALNRWIERFYHVTTLRFLKPDKAGQAITGLKHMIARKRASVTT